MREPNTLEKFFLWGCDYDIRWYRSHGTHKSFPDTGLHTRYELDTTTRFSWGFVALSAMTFAVFIVPLALIFSGFNWVRTAEIAGGIVGAIEAVLLLTNSRTKFLNVPASSIDGIKHFDEFVLSESGERERYNGMLSDSELLHAVKKYLENLKDQEPDYELMLALTDLMDENDRVRSASEIAQQYNVEINEVSELELAFQEHYDHTQEIIERFNKATEETSYLYKEARLAAVRNALDAM